MNVENKFRSETYSDEFGYFNFKGVPPVKVMVTPDNQRICWERGNGSIDLQRLEMHKDVEFK